MQAAVLSSRCWPSTMGSPGVGTPSLVAPVSAGNRPALFLLQEGFPGWPRGSDPTAPHGQRALCWAVGSCSLLSCTTVGAAGPMHLCWESPSGSAGTSTAQVPLATGHQEVLQKPALSLPAPAVAPHVKPSLSPAGNWLFPQSYIPAPLASWGTVLSPAGSLSPAHPRAHVLG